MLNVLRGLITAFIIGYFGWQYTNIGGVVVTAGLVYAYNEYILKLVDPINIIFTQIIEFQHSHVRVTRYHKLIESQLESYDKEHIEKYQGKIKFDNIWFSYIEDNYVLKGVSFDIEPGQMIGLVGHTGSGKSTLINRLVGKKAQTTGNKPGVTKALSWIRINKDLELLDSPGILWPKLEDQEIADRFLSQLHAEHYVGVKYKAEALFRFSDHKNYRKCHIRRIESASAQFPTAAVITTEKDAQRLRDLPFLSENFKKRLMYLEIKVVINS